MARQSKRVYVGLEGSGKSLMMAKESVDNVYRNARWLRKTGIVRPIMGNLAWSQSFKDFAASKGVPVISWQHLADLPYLSECDLYIDELATYFDSRLFAELPLNVRLWLAQAEKLGVQIVGAAQDFGQVDKSVRRLCKEVYEVKKVIGSRRPMKTAPRVRFAWGLCFLWQLDPRSFAGEQVEMKSLSLLPSMFFIRKKLLKMFDTSERVNLSEPPPLQKIVRVCPEDGYKKIKYI